MLNIVLHEPEIPANTGNIGRTCCATGTRLHLIEPLGFVLTDKTVKRAGMDYWDKLEVFRYDDWEDFKAKNPDAKVYMATTKAKRKHTDVHYEPDCYIMFGKESAGIPEEILVDNEENCVRIPMGHDIRSLNLSNSVAVVLYEALRQNDFLDLETEGNLHRLDWKEQQVPMSIIRSKDLVHEYIRRDEEGNVESIHTALDHVNLNVEPGQFISILGHNGSGKSTFAKHINALLTPSEGTIWVDEMNTSDDEYTFAVRQTAGMVFQNPDNQIIASVVDEDVAFGPENIGVPTEEILVRVDKSLKMVGMQKYRSHSPNKLSGGQKQRVAIAGVMAMEPKCIILDEPTAMLDPDGRADVLRAVHTLNREKGITVILITHYMEEVVDSDYVFVMEKGKVFMEGTPREIFKDVELLKEHSLDVPQVTLLAHELRKSGLLIPECILTRKELLEALTKLNLRKLAAGQMPVTSQPEDKKSFGDNVLILDHASYKYSPGTAYEVTALDDVSLSIKEGEFIGVIGHTGSGKSTLVQHLNGLIKATEGHIYYRGQDIYDKEFDIKDLRTQVGMVFQYPEHQLFETTVFKDVQFGPKNQGLDEKEQIKRAYEALTLVKLPEELYLASPFELSGGQKRRAAIAGVIAMKPAVLILDEPTAGLDPKGRDDILGLIKDMHEKRGDTVILVSHSMEDVANYVDRIIVMDAGHPAFDGTPKEVFAHYKELEKMGLAAPQVTYVMNDLIDAGFDVDATATTVTEARDSILKALN